MIRTTQGYSFDDLLLKPKFTDVSSRDTDVDLTSHLPKGFSFKIPICSANMKAVTETDMANLVSEMGGMALLHRFCSIEEQLAMFRQCSRKNSVGISVGIKGEDLARAERAIAEGCRILCLDVAHAHSSGAASFIKSLFSRNDLSEILLIAGNVATYEGARFLYELGIDVVKCGIGNGATCSTRLQTGNGVPQMTALSECYDLHLNANTFDHNRVAIMADGGIKLAGDVGKSLCFSSMAMIGRLLAGTDESPSELVTVDGKKFKRYFGSSTLKNKHVEGVSGLVPYQGPAAKVIEHLLDGLTSCCSYQGAKNLESLRKNPEFYVLTNAGWTESKPHDIIL